MQTFQDLYRYRFVLSTLVAKELKAEYRSMSLGFMWSLLNPLVMVAVLSFVLVSFFGGKWNHPSLVVVVLIPYNFFAYCLSHCSQSIVGNSSLVKKVAFPRQVLPIATILTYLVHFAIQSTLIVAILLIFTPPGQILSFNLLWLLPVFVVHFGLCVGAGLLAASLNVVYRDTGYIIESLLNVMFWLSPVLYDAWEIFQKTEHTWLKWVYYSNPLSGILTSYRAVLFYGRAPDPTVLAMALVGTLIFGVVGIRTFWTHERQFADLIQ